MNDNGKLNKAFNLSATAGILILINAVLLYAAATWFPWVIPTLPGPTGNSNVPFASLAAFGLICGTLVLVGALMTRGKTLRSRTCGIIVIAFSIPTVIMGGGFIIGFILGIIGGVSAFRETKIQATKPGHKNLTSEH
jgi:hypothetical protein